MTNATVKRGRGYQGLDAWQVENPDEQRFVPGRTIGIAPAHEEAPGWRAILCGYDAEDNFYVVPLEGHFGELRVRKCLSNERSGGHTWLPADAPAEPGRYTTGDECDWTQAKCLALSTAHAFGLEGRA